MQRLFQIRLLAVLDRLYCTLQHFYIQTETDRLDLAALAVTQQLAGTTNFQVMGGLYKTGTQILGVTDGFQAFFGIRGEFFAAGHQQVGIGLVVAAAHAAAQLVQLGQAELVGTVNQDGVGTGHVDAGFNNGSGHQHIGALVVKIGHDLLQLALAHPAVADANARFGYQFGQLFGASVDGFNVVVQVIHLAAAQQFAQQGFLDDAVLAWHDKGAYRQAACRRGGNDGQVAQVGEGHVQRARNGRGGLGEDVHFAAQGLEALFLAHAKAVFLVDDDQPQIIEFDVILQQLVGADDNIQLAFLQQLQCCFAVLGAAETAHHFDLDRPVGKAVAKAVVMLLGQQGSGHQHSHLFATVRGNKGGAHGDFGFAKADIAADQPIHGGAGQHIAAHGINGQLLVGCFCVGEGGAEGGVVCTGITKSMTLACGTAGVDVQQFGGDITHLFGGLALGLAPLFGAKAVQGSAVGIAAAVAGNQVQVGDGDIQPGLLGIFQLQEFGGLAFDFQGDQSLVAADTMVDVDHWRAFAKFGQIAYYQFAGVFGSLVTALALADALAQQAAFRNDRQLFQLQSGLQGRNTDAQGAVAGQEIRPAGNLLRPECGALQ